MINLDIKNLQYLHITKAPWNYYCSVFFDYKGYCVHILEDIPFNKLKIYILITLQELEKNLKKGIDYGFLDLPFSVYYDPLSNYNIKKNDSVESEQLRLFNV